MDDMRFIGAYCAATGQARKYAVCLVEEGKPSLVFFDGTDTDMVNFDGKEPETGAVYRVWEATCTGKCKIGKPRKECVDEGLYSPRSCATHYVEKVDFKQAVFSMTMAQFVGIAACIDAQDKQEDKVKREFDDAKWQALLKDPMSPWNYRKCKEEENE